MKGNHQDTLYRRRGRRIDLRRNRRRPVLMTLLLLSCAALLGVRGTVPGDRTDRDAGHSSDGLATLPSALMPVGIAAPQADAGLTYAVAAGDADGVLIAVN